MTDPDVKPRLPLVRSTIAILIAVAINFIVSIAIDSIFHAIGVFPPMTEGMPDIGDNLLALSYRLVITVLAGVVALRYANYALGWNALAIALVGFTLGMAGVVVATSGPRDFGPDWYPWSLAFSAFPCMWVAWLIAKRGRRGVSQAPPAD